MDAKIWAVEAAKMLASKNLDKILDLFDDDAVVYEPFSTQGILNGLAEVTPFLKVVCDNPNFLFNEKPVWGIEVKYVSPKTGEVHIRITGPTNYLLEFEFRELPIEKLGKTVKIKKLRIDVKD